MSAARADVGLLAAGVAGLLAAGVAGLLAGVAGLLVAAAVVPTLRARGNTGVANDAEIRG